LNEIEKPVMAVLDAYKAAVFAKDVDAFVSLYDRDVRIFDMWGSWSYDGLEAWRGMVSEWFASLGTERVGVVMDDVRITVAHDLAVVHAFLTFKGLSAEGKELRAMQNRLTCTLRKVDGAWKIFHEHTSSPADFETAKVMLKR
jgi:uncharacterized protein (TIGR02246 family)